MTNTTETRAFDRSAAVTRSLLGAVGFAAIASAAFAYGGWSRGVGSGVRSRLGVVLGVVIIGGFFAGAALSMSPVGVSLIWIAVIAAWAWLAMASAHVYAWSPHPLGGRS